MIKLSNLLAINNFTQYLYFLDLQIVHCIFSTLNLQYWFYKCKKKFQSVSCKGHLNADPFIPGIPGAYLRISTE